MIDEVYQNETKRKIAYIPLDRALALMHREVLSSERVGTAMFADVSGFSALAKILRQQLGNKQGAETLIRHLNAVFERLIGTVHRYGGSVISFAGDAMTCWFDGERHGDAEFAACSALMAACIMQEELAAIAAIQLENGDSVPLHIKIALATGIVHRWVLGSPDIQLIDTILGEPIDRLAIAEKLAQSGQIVVDAETYEATQDYAHLHETYTPTAQEPFVRVTLTETCAEPMPWIYMTDDEVETVVINQWLLPDVHAHFDSGIHDMTELRTAVALFLKFEAAEASELPMRPRIERFIKWAQGIIHQHGGNLLQISFGDKGSYLYAAFGAPISHKNNALPAIDAAHVLRKPPALLGIMVQIGVSTGVMRSGSYGSVYRCTYGVQGDEVNIAARLMMHGDAGDVTVSKFVMQQVEHAFTFSEPTGILCKGQPEPVQAAKLLQKTYQSASTAIMDLASKSSLVGRVGAWTRLYRSLRNQIKTGTNGVTYLLAEAGMGKTYLSTAVRKVLERETDVLWLSAPCNAMLSQTLAPFKFVLLRLFGQDADTFDSEYQSLYIEIQQAQTLSQDERNQLLRGLRHNRLLLRAWSLPDHQLSDVSLDSAQDMQHLSDALFWLLSAMSQKRPLVLNIQDAHLLDEMSAALVERLLATSYAHAISVLLSGRIRSDGQVYALHDTLLSEAVITLGPLSPEETYQLIESTLKGKPSERLRDNIVIQAEGNPLYIRLLVQHLLERGYISLTHEVWDLNAQYDHTDLPLELQTHVTATIDNLGLKLKSAVQAAAILGIKFDQRVLAVLLREKDIEPLLMDGVRHGVLVQIDDLHYGFSHALLRDVAYTMLSQRRRATFHRAAAQAIGQIQGDTFAAITEIAAHNQLASAAS